ncbi:MAG: hypothetical protein RMJ14_01800 [Nitrososphaerota archaeon]|nr:hypothetical protein [Aigarchaeota archaeon]MDW8076357.1 hypothetical protein [Nitrososphaerota archaeon]
MESIEGERLILGIASLAFELGIRPSELLSSSILEFVLDLKIAELYKQEIKRMMRGRA